MPELSAIENVIYLYSGLHETYGWTKKEIDSEELEYILDLLITVAKTKGNGSGEPDEVYIDDIL